MRSLSISTVPLSPFRLQTQTRISTFSSRANLHSFNHNPTRTVSKVRGLREENDSRFVDENGAVDDMEGYLDNLSLEYDSVWDTKPSWYVCDLVCIRNQEVFMFSSDICSCVSQVSAVDDNGNGSIYSDM